VPASSASSVGTLATGISKHLSGTECRIQYTNKRVSWQFSKNINQVYCTSVLRLSVSPNVNNLVLFSHTSKCYFAPINTLISLIVKSACDATMVIFVILSLCNGEDFSLELTVTDSHFAYRYHHQSEMTSSLPSAMVFNRCTLLLWSTVSFFFKHAARFWIEEWNFLGFRITITLFSEGSELTSTVQLAFVSKLHNLSSLRQFFVLFCNNLDTWSSYGGGGGYITFVHQYAPSSITRVFIHGDWCSHYLTDY
jgi:hypothetical protein